MLLLNILRRKRGPKDCTLMVVFGSGGHTTEMLQMLKTIQFERYKHVCFVIGHSDWFSSSKIASYFKSESGIDIAKCTNLQTLKIFRAREVKQSYITSVFTTIRGFFGAIIIILSVRPDLLVTNGPGTVIPLAYCNFFINKLFLLNLKSKILFVESFCRVHTLSLTGKLIRPIASKFIVQWEELHRQVPSSILYNEKLL